MAADLVAIWPSSNHVLVDIPLNIDKPLTLGQSPIGIMNTFHLLAALFLFTSHVLSSRSALSASPGDIIEEIKNETEKRNQTTDHYVFEIPPEIEEAIMGNDLESALFHSVLERKFICVNVLYRHLSGGLEVDAPKTGIDAAIRLLLERSNVADRKNARGDTLLHYSAQNGLFEIVKMISANTRKVNELDEFYNTPFMLAADHGHVEIAELLLPLIDNFDQTNCDGDTPLHIAIEKMPNIAQKLLPFAKATINQQNSRGDTPLMLAIARGPLELAELLVPMTDRINLTNDDGNAALHLAAINGQVGLLRMLLEKPHLISIPNKAGKTPCKLAEENNHFGAQYCLLDAASSLQANAVTILHGAAYDGQLDDVEKILKDEPNLVHAVNKWGFTPVMEAMRMGHVDVAEKILEMMKDVDQMDLNGNTALHLAAYWGQLSMVQKLLLKAKLIDKPNNLGQTPLMVAETYPRKDVADSMRAVILSALNAAK